MTLPPATCTVECWVRADLLQFTRGHPPTHSFQVGEMKSRWKGRGGGQLSQQTLVEYFCVSAGFHSLVHFPVNPPNNHAPLQEHHMVTRGKRS